MSSGDEGKVVISWVARKGSSGERRVLTRSIGVEITKFPDEQSGEGRFPRSIGGEERVPLSKGGEGRSR
jgi:hypothetical protein